MQSLGIVLMCNHALALFLTLNIALWLFDAFLICVIFIDRKSEEAVHKATKKDKEQMLLVFSFSYI